MDSQLEREIEKMIQLATAKYHAENVARLTKIEERIIGIDGNGTGRMGAVQRIEMAISGISSELKDLVGSVSNIKLDVGGSLKTKTLWAIGASLGAVLLGTMGTLAAGWFEHVAGWK